MEVWAVYAYGASNLLQEMMTIKSDDTAGRVKAYEHIVKGENIPAAEIPESFKVLVKEMQSLCLDVKLIGAEKKEPEEPEDSFELGKEIEKQNDMSDDDALSMISDGLLDMDFDSDLLIDDNGIVGGEELIGGPAKASHEDADSDAADASEPSGDGEGEE